MSKDKSSFGFGMGLLAGVVGGLIAGVLYAPRPGAEMRAKVKETVYDLAEKHSPAVNEAKKQAMEMIKSSKEKIEDTYKKFNDNLKAQKLAHAKNCEIDVYEI